MAKLIGWHRGLDKKKVVTPALPSEEPLHVESAAWENLTWVNIEKPTEKEMKYLEETFHFHPLALDDCLSRKQIPKLDTYAGYIFFVFHYPMYDKATRIASKRQWSAFIGENFLVTISSGELKTLTALFKECQTNEETCKEIFSGGSGFLLYRILDRSVDSYFPVLDKILSLMEDVEDTVFDEEIEAAKGISVLRRCALCQTAG